ncbi:MAG: UvrB/UvrC motif-containing protein [Candidatus Latescibacterota bacterium]
MKCQICKSKNANIIFTKIVNNEKITLNICADCAREKGLTINLTSEEDQQSELLFESDSIIFGMHDKTDFPEITCRQCGLTFAEFKKSGFFGCDQCIESFGPHMEDILKQIHGSSVHEGKTPLKISDDRELIKHLRSLRSRLKRCIESEEYERAAEIRDKIASLEDKIKSEI